MTYTLNIVEVSDGQKEQQQKNLLDPFLAKDYLHYSFIVY
jgi:hypothetical protein